MDKLDAETLRMHKGKSFVGISTAAAIFDQKGQIFLAQRSINTRDEHGTWDVCGGGLKWGVVVQDNMRREMAEEFAVESAETLHFLGFREAFRTDHNSDKTHWVCLDHIIILTDAEAEKVCINEPENFDKSGWFDLNNLPSPLHSVITPELIGKLKQKLAELTNL